MRRLAVAALALAAFVGGVASLPNVRAADLGYLAQSVGGHFALLRAARPVAEVLADPTTPEPLRERLLLAQQIRDFAVTELALPDNASYRRYADLRRSAAVWNVVAAPELGLALETWCFPVVGCVGYRGYFERAEADGFAAGLRGKGLEVDVYGVPAYSTLGRLPGAYFADPLLSTFITWPEVELARMIFHELAHQVVYASGDTMFNESFATAVERIGAARWIAAHATPEAAAEYAGLQQRRHEFRALALRARAELDLLYRSAASDADKRAAKAQILQRLRDDYAALRDGPWQGYAGYDAWIARANNASLGVLAAYHEWVPQFERLYEREGRDLKRFYAAAGRIAALPPGERRATLEAL